MLTHFLLTGNYPFSDSNSKRLQVKIKKGQIQPCKEWDKISEKSKDFINKFLNTDENKRMSIKEALSHEWIITESPKEPLQVFGNLSQSLLGLVSGAIHNLIIANHIKNLISLGSCQGKIFSGLKSLNRLIVDKKKRPLPPPPFLKNLKN